MDTISTRLDGERERARQFLVNLRTTLDSVEDHLSNKLPTTEARQALIMTAVSLSERLAVIDILAMIMRGTLGEPGKK